MKKIALFLICAFSYAHSSERIEIHNRCRLKPIGECAMYSLSIDYTDPQTKIVKQTRTLDTFLINSIAQSVTLRVIRHGQGSRTIALPDEKITGVGSLILQAATGAISLADVWRISEQVYKVPPQEYVDEVKDCVIAQ